ncbi:hypothetical protein DL239_14745 [Sedimentitalea sp. CY04]|uniref:Uncharacterized protein n=1 Tax=Parasedimentitalea denitrificans TaxID=2211118 RepID=A0ABX0W9B6_9RHOB|nr:hypothetical protein [Sedimentitalea sp. CY04]NIZ62234.1 hypothetical protein [Sedimentitalea sp. CY04]
MTIDKREFLTDEEIEQLADALEDGFRDDYIPGMEMRKLVLGNLFETNPLGDDAVYFPVADGLNEERLRVATSRDNRDELDLFKETSWETDMLWRNAFGFNLDKVEKYFRSKHDEVIGEYKRRYEKYLSNGDFDEAYDYDFGVFSGEPDTFEQWVEGRIFPYTRRWFERHIFTLIKEVRGSQRHLSEDLVAEGKPVLPGYWLEKLVVSAMQLGRMVEHYRWKFQYESSIVRRKEQSQKAGSGGGKSSSLAREARLEAFMFAIEQLADLFPRMSEDAIVMQAFENAAKREEKFWKVAPGQAERYVVPLRSEQPFKRRYDAIFRGNA